MFNHMVEDSAGMDTVFRALSHSARRDMLRRLAAGDLSVGELAAPLTMSFAAASKHVKVLQTAGLVRRTVTGRRHVCRLEPAPLADATAWLRFYEPAGVRR
jgi:DNA-binding transcriptional ArsR family regulator